jgi:hypothetical protein
MKKGIVEGLVSGEIKKYGMNVFKKSDIDLKIGAGRVMNIHLGGVDANCIEKRDLKIKIAGFEGKPLFSPVSEYWLPQSFEFLEAIGEKSAEVHWNHCLKKIWPEMNEEKISVELMNHILWHEYSDEVPYLTIKGEVKDLSHFARNHSGRLDFDEAYIHIGKYHLANQDLEIKIKINSFDFSCPATNKEAIQYARHIDGFLKQK